MGGKTREQLAEEKKIAIMVRVAPLTGLENLNLQGLKEKADELFKKVIRMETEKYDMEQRRARQDYDLRELQTRMNVKLRAQALKKGLDPGALTGKHPPKIQVASKFGRRADSRSYDDKKNLFEGGYEREVQDKIESQWQEKYNEFIDRNRSKLPKWFGERPGKGNQYDDDSDDYEDEDEEKKLREQKKQDEQRKAKEEAELKKKEEDERLRRLEEMEKKRQESVKKASEDKKKMEGGDKLSSMQAARGEKGKTREQLAEEKKIAIMVRVAPLTGLENLTLQGLKEKADELFKKVIRMEK